MSTNKFCTDFLNTLRGPGHPGKIPGTSQVPPFETQGRQTFEGGHNLFGHHPFAWKTLTPLGGLRTQKSLCSFFLPDGCLLQTQGRYGAGTVKKKTPMRAFVFRRPHMVGELPTAQRAGDNFGESLGGRQTSSELVETPWISQKFPQPSQKCPGNFPGTPLTVDSKSNPEVPRKFPRLPQKSLAPPQK